jgi:hypothetical protein
MKKIKTWQLLVEGNGQLFRVGVFARTRNEAVQLYKLRMGGHRNVLSSMSAWRKKRLAASPQES